jgi:hypothetical protein
MSLERAKRRINQRVKKSTDDKAKILRRNYAEKLKEYVDTYFNNWSEDKDINAIAYDEIQKAWTIYCGNVNRVQKLVTLKPEQFAQAVAHVISLNPQFQEVKDITKL